MKHITSLALVATFAGLALAACSSDPESSSTTGTAGSTSHPGTAGAAGTGTAGATTGTAGATTGTAGATTGTAGASSTAGAGAGGSAGAGTGGSAGAGTGGSGTAGSGGAGGAGNPNAVVATCAAQTYTPTATPGAACVTKAVPVTTLVAAFETAGTAPGWGVYPNVDGKTGFMPTMATPSAGGANASTMALNFTVANVEQGIKIEVGFGMQCQDVRTFKGLSFWAKGTIDAATMPFAVEANNIVVQIGSETSLLGGCMGGTCSAAPPDKRVAISADWKEYRVPFDCFGDGKVFDGYYTKILFSAFGTNSTFSIDQVGYYQ